ncbi:MAG: hypothetical protein GXP38_11265, partial [Chloroflexi bacterium]|nr:hypothetical protein [Chloroflexota bacterium]
ENHVEQVIAEGGGKAALSTLSLETCGIPPTGLNGLVQKLHLANIYTLYAHRRKQLQSKAQAKLN